MKLVNYQLQSQIELLSEQKSNDYFKKYIKSILEDTSKPYYQRADYIGLSLNELKNKIDFLSKDIKELQSYKKKLSSALDIAKQETAQVLIDNGIDRIDGNIISSITLSQASTKIKETLKILDEKALMSLGYVKFELDTEAIQKALQTDKGKKEINEFVEIETQTSTIPAKVKVNLKRSANNVTDEILDLEQIEVIEKVA